jgi:hypothetical protein
MLGQQSPYLALVFLIATGVGGVVWPYYEAVLKEDGPDRKRLLDRLVHGGGPRAFYISQMTALLDRIDRLIGDAGTGDHSVSRLLRLSTARPCWTGRSFDTCALLAVAYPIASLIVTWLLAGDAGPVGVLLGFAALPDWWVRLAKGAAICFLTFTILRHLRSSRWRSLIWMGVAVAVAVPVAGASPSYSHA